MNSSTTKSQVFIPSLAAKDETSIKNVGNKIT